MANDQFIIYQTNDGLTKIDVRLDNESVWLTQGQMQKLFNQTKQNISLHINNIFKEGELQEISVVKESLTTANDGKKYKNKFYSLDIIISVGYRVKSKQGTQFRIWANKILKEYLIKGYALNEQKLKEQANQLNSLKQTVNLLGNVLKSKELSSDEANGLLKVVTDYSYALDVLDRYDHQQLGIEGTTDQQLFVATYEEAIIAIKGLERFIWGKLFVCQ